MFFNGHKKNGRLAAGMLIPLMRAASTKHLMQARNPKTAEFPPNFFNDEYMFGFVLTFGQLCLDYLHGGLKMSGIKRGEYLLTYVDVVADTCLSGYSFKLFNWDEIEKREAGRPSAFSTEEFKAGDHAAMLIFGAFHGRLRDNGPDEVLAEAEKIAASARSLDNITGLTTTDGERLYGALVEVTLSRRINEIWPS
jgi:hypothetical protein